MAQQATATAVETTARAPTQGAAAALEALAPKAARKIAKPCAPAPQAPRPLQEEFAKLLARRIESGATQFDLRLDPPDLGRVEARLTLADDGKAALTVIFDNQSAFDIFAGDEVGLRTALAERGFEFGDGAVAFLIREASAQHHPAQSGIDGPAAQLPVLESSIVDLRV